MKEIERLEKKIKKLVSEKAQLMDNLDEKDECYEELNRHYWALRHHEYDLTADFGTGRIPIYRIEVVALNPTSRRTSLGTIISTTHTTDIQLAKVIQLALSQVFDNKTVTITVKRKKDVWKDDDSEWMLV